MIARLGYQFHSPPILRFLPEAPKNDCTAIASPFVFVAEKNGGRKFSKQPPAQAYQDIVSTSVPSFRDTCTDMPCCVNMVVFSWY